jgi:hypothetical protein
VRAGMPAVEARRQAVLKFGAVEAIRETYQAERGLPFIETLLQDLRYALRILLRNRALLLSPFSRWRSASAHRRQLFLLWTQFYCVRFLIRIRKKSCARGNKHATVTA